MHVHCSAKTRKKRENEIYEKYGDFLGFSKSKAKTVEKYDEIIKNGDERILKGYKKTVEKVDINALTEFDLYNETSEEIKRKLIGKKRNDGLEIKNYSVHFIDRILGQTAEPHSRMRTGVAIDEALNAFKNGTVDNKKSTETSVKISDGNVVVTINPKTGNLIQTNRKKK